VKKTIAHLLNITLFTFLISSCATEVTKTEVIPKDVKTYTSTGKSILISPVTVIPGPKGDIFVSIPTIDGDTYQKAISAGLTKSNLFTRVEISGTTDYTLTTEILGQRTIGAYISVELFFVRYELNESGSGRTLWSENIFTYAMLSPDDIYVGDERRVAVLESASRENINILIEKLAALISS